MNNVGNQGSANRNAASDCREGFVWPSGSNAANFICRKAPFSPHSSKARKSTSIDRVLNVICVASYRQMKRIAARRVVAVVANNLFMTRRPSPINKRPCHHVRHRRAISSDLELAVSRLVAVLHIWPAAIKSCRLIDLRPETVSQRSSLRSVLRHLIPMPLPIVGTTHASRLARIPTDANGAMCGPSRIFDTILTHRSFLSVTRSRTFTALREQFSTRPLYQEGCA